MKRTPVIQGDRLTVPLFHGTSSLFHSSIVGRGLGGRDIVEEIGLRSAARSLLDLCAGYSAEDELLDAMSGCEKIAADPAKDRLGGDYGFSFRYGGTYLSASWETAARYALLYPGGGEALTYVARLYGQLSSVNPELAESKEFARLREFTAQSGRPMLVRADGVLINSLRAEQGGGIDRLIADIEGALEEPEYYDAFVSQLNFELTGSVPLVDLHFYEIQEVIELDENGGSHRVIKLTDYKP